MIHLFLLFAALLFATRSSIGRSHALALDTARARTSVRRVESKVNVLLRLETNNERGRGDDLLAHANVTLRDEHTSVVNAASETALVHLRLKTALQKVFDLQGQHIIKLHARLVQHTNANETTDDGVTLEKTLRVLLVELEKLTSSTTDLGQRQSDAPDLLLIL